MVHKCFDHDCNCHWLQRRQFQAVEDQELQNLWHHGYYAQDKNTHIVNCQHCEKALTCCKGDGDGQSPMYPLLNNAINNRLYKQQQICNL